jgi:ketosteroid isomerase-like protein
MHPQRRHIALAGMAATLAAAGLNPAAQAQSAEANAVAQAGEELRKAMIAVDRAKLAALTSDHLSYGHSGGRVENKQQFIANLESRANAFRSIELGDQTVAVSENEAIVRHLFTGETANPAGQVTPVHIGVLQVWRKEGNAWRLLARQAYKL